MARASRTKLAARAVGATGRVIGVDMTPEMISKARKNQAIGRHASWNIASAGRAVKLDVVVKGWVDDLSFHITACARFAHALQPFMASHAGQRLGFAGESRIFLRHRPGVAQFFRQTASHVSRSMNAPKDKTMSAWFWYAIGAAVLYGLHQVFTKMASDRIGDGVGGFVVEASAALTIFAYLVALYFSGRWSQQVSTPGVVYSVLTGICVGVGTVFFFLLFQKGGPLSAVPMILAGGAALMAVVGIFFFRELASLPRVLGIVMAIGGLYLLRK